MPDRSSREDVFDREVETAVPREEGTDTKRLPPLGRESDEFIEECSSHDALDADPYDGASTRRENLTGSRVADDSSAYELGSTRTDS
jgi:hypothetical protein